MSFSYYTSGSERAERVHSLFERIARRYDLINDIQSLGLHRLWKRTLLKEAKKYAYLLNRENTDFSSIRVLDLCCGTGDLALMLAKHGFQVTGVDFSEEMLRVARRRTALGSFTQPPHWICQDILKLRERESSYDIVTCGYGMRNLADIPMALRLAYTLLKPGGKIMILEFGKPENSLLRILFHLYLKTAVPLFGLLFCGNFRAYSYILDSLKHYPAQNGIDTLLKQIGFKQSSWKSFIGSTMTLSLAQKPTREETHSEIGTPNFR